MEDYIMLDGFKDPTAKPKTVEQIQKIIDNDLAQRKKKKGKKSIHQNSSFSAALDPPNGAMLIAIANSKSFYPNQSSLLLRHSHDNCPQMAEFFLIR